MKFHRHLIVASVLALSAPLQSAQAQQPYAVGQPFESFSVQDQHEQAFVLEPSKLNYVLVSHDMETGKQANAVLTTLGKDYLTAKQAVYLANIHGMPAIGRMFAIPKMKKYVHRILLGDDAGLISKFPQQAGKVTVIGLKAGKVATIQYWTPGSEALDGLLK